MASNSRVWDELENVGSPIESVALERAQPTSVIRGKRKRPPIPKGWNAIVLKPIIKNGEVIGTEGWFDIVENPEGRLRTYIDEGLLWTTKKQVFAVTQDEKKAIDAYTPPEYIENLPERLYRAFKGCDAYSMFLAFKKAFLEKLKVFLLFGIMGLLVFVMFLMLSGK